MAAEKVCEDRYPQHGTDYCKRVVEREKGRRDFSKFVHY